MNESRPDRVLIAAPVGRDAELIAAQLRAAGISCEVCPDVPALCAELVPGAGALIMTEEALTHETTSALMTALADAPPWSEIPIIILTAAPLLDSKPHVFEGLLRRTNVTLVDRPVRIKSLVSAAQSALRSRQRQYDVRDLMQQLEERIHERDRFLAILGHELRNPLGAILLASEMTDEDGKLGEDNARLIERQARHLTRLVNDLLDLSRVAAGKIVLKRQSLDLAESVAQSVRTVMPLAQQHAIDVAVRTPAARIVAFADPVRVDQIVTNLLTNAIKYTPEGGHVTVDLTEQDGEALIRVTDDGVGIAPERIGGIFEIFAQADNAIGRAQGGMGIGLALVRDLTQLHGGKVAARSDGEGEGSEFVVTLPLASGPMQEADTPPEPLQEHQAPARLRIAIVEDNKDVRDLLRLKLRRLGHEVLDASDGVEGLRVLVDERPDLALVDLGLPGIDGFEVARRARQALGRDLILVAVSGFGQPEDKRRALEAGFDEHMTKPADVKDIETLLLRLPRRNSAPSEDVQ